VTELRGHTLRVNSIDFHPQGHWLASASDDRTIRLWDPYSGQILRELDGHQTECQCVRFSPNGERLATAAYDGTVLLWDPGAGAIV
jgi:WD40 repeat protein